MPLTMQCLSSNTDPTIVYIYTYLNRCMFVSVVLNVLHNMEDYKDILMLEQLAIQYQNEAESSRHWVPYLQV